MSADVPVGIGPLIYSDPDFRDGMPCIAGTGMSVREVAARYRSGQSAEEIAEDIGDIPLSHIYAAFAYYLVNREQIDAELEEEANLYERLANEHRRTTSSS